MKEERHVTTIRLPKNIWVEVRRLQENGRVKDFTHAVIEGLESIIQAEKVLATETTGKVFMSTGGTAFCSEMCCNEYGSENYRNAWREWNPAYGKKCRNCGKSFL